MASTFGASTWRQLLEEDFCSTDSDDEYEERAPEPPKTRGKKRARTAKAKGKSKVTGKRHKKAKLSMLPAMPIDVLYEVFSLVHPRDMLHISWTAKVFNRFLTSKSSRHVWQASFREIPERDRPPPCPSEITEMTYANLVYGRYCMNCADNCPTIPGWRALVRICGQCVEEIAMDLPSAQAEGLAHFTLMDTIFPTFRVKYSHRGVVDKVLRSDYKQFKEELAAAGEGSRDTVVEKCKSLVREREEFSRAISKLKRLEEEAKEEARADVQQRRIDRIWEKLSEDGWHEEIAACKQMYKPELLRIKGVMMNRPLGEKAWAGLRAPLHEFMKEKSERIHAKLAADRCRSRLNQVEEIVSSFRFSLPHPHDFCPSAADVCWVPEVRKAVVDGTEGEFQDCMADIRSRLPELSAAWLEERRQFFLRLLPQDSPTLKHLSLAITLFDCMKCHEFGMHIGEALSHHCRRHYSNGFKAQFSNAPSASVYFYDTAAPWDLGLAEYRHSEAFAALAREIVLECGENPDIITTREMNRKHHRFARFDTDGTVSVLNWVEALEHKRGHARTPCRFLQPHELSEYGQQENPGGFWGCLHCWGTGQGRPEAYNEWFSIVKDHLALSHQIENPSEDDYFNVDPSYATPIEYRPRKGA